MKHPHGLAGVVGCGEVEVGLISAGDCNFCLKRDLGTASQCYSVTLS